MKSSVAEDQSPSHGGRILGMVADMTLQQPALILEASALVRKVLVEPAITPS